MSFVGGKSTWRKAQSLCRACVREHRRFATASPGARPLEGVKIVDLSRVLAGPYATALLADLGADVVKVEHPTRGDDTRAWAPPSAPTVTAQRPPSAADPPGYRPPDWSKLPDESTYFLSTNRNKRSLAVNLKSPEGVAIVHKMIKDADVVVENFLPGTLAKMKLGYEDAKRINPSIIYASITGYGQTGPKRTAPGYDVMVEAEAGLMHITGTKDGPPTKVGVAITDITTGLFAHGAIMAALLGRARTGKGTWLDCSLFEAQVATLANIGSSYLIAGKEATRQGNAHPSIVLYETVPTQDGQIFVGTGNDAQFAKFCALVGKPEWATSPDYSTNGLRVVNRDRLVPLVQELLATRPTKEWLAAFEGAGFPFSPINNLAQTYSHEQLVYRKMVQEVEHSRAGTIKLTGPPVLFDGERFPIYRAPPVLGEHTLEVLRELGYSDEEIVKLQEGGAI